MVWTIFVDGGKYAEARNFTFECILIKLNECGANSGVSIGVTLVLDWLELRGTHRHTEGYSNLNSSCKTCHRTATIFRCVPIEVLD